MIEAVIPCPHDKSGAHNPADWLSDVCPGGRRVRLVEVQPDYGDMSFIGSERIREALDTYDLKLTKDWQIRILAHAAEKFLRLDAAVPGPTYRIEEET